MSYKFGDRVMPGRNQGEKTLGEVVKINRKSVKVKILEDRGSRSKAGQVWSVHPELITAVPGDFPRRPRPAALPLGDRAGQMALALPTLARLSEAEKRALKIYFQR